MTEINTICPICGYGDLVEYTHQYSDITLLHSICNYCEEWVTTPEQSRENKKRIMDNYHD